MGGGLMQSRAGSPADGIEGALSLARLVGGYACLVLFPELLTRCRWRRVVWL